MKITYINPNATESMTDAIVETAQQVMPDADIIGLTNDEGPFAIEGPEDGDAAIPGLLKKVDEARAAGATAIVIACFDDTGLMEAQARSDCPVLGIGQSSYVMAALLGLKFSVVTSVKAAVPVIEENIARQGHAGRYASVRASGLPVLEIEKGSPATLSVLTQHIHAAQKEDGAGCVILGCAGMAAFKGRLEQSVSIPLIDGVAASALLARAACASLERVRQPA